MRNDKGVGNSSSGGVGGGGDFTDKRLVPRRELTSGMDFLFTNLSIALLFIGNDIKAGVAVFVI